MKAILITSPGAAENLVIDEFKKPEANHDEILVKVAATAVNRADILQREGKYPPPKGASPVLGLEMSGEVAALGRNVTKWKTGDQIFGLLPGGGYAEYAVIHQDMALPLPENLDLTEAAAIPEVFLTAYQALFWLGKLQKGETVLIHAGGSGVGTAAIQLAKAQDATIIITASSGKHHTCLHLGANFAIDYKTQDFQEKVAAYTAEKGVNVIIDFVAAPYFHQNIDCLATDGRLVLLATLGGGKIENFDLRKILIKRLQILGSTLRARNLDYQIALTQAFSAFALPLFQNKQIKPVIDSVFDWKEVQAAHKYMEANKNIGKIVLKIS
jgi:tumor protein p53-inducible protein 3